MNEMKNYLPVITVLALLLLTSCEAIGGIFKAGMGFGIFLVLFVIIVILVLVFRKRKD